MFSAPILLHSLSTHVSVLFAKLVLERILQWNLFLSVWPCSGVVDTSNLPLLGSLSMTLLWDPFLDTLKQVRVVTFLWFLVSPHGSQRVTFFWCWELTGYLGRPSLFLDLKAASLLAPSGAISGQFLYGPTEIQKKQHFLLISFGAWPISLLTKKGQIGPDFAQCVKNCKPGTFVSTEHFPFQSLL